jgi:hypothetical protein
MTRRRRSRPIAPGTPSRCGSGTTSSATSSRSRPRHDWRAAPLSRWARCRFSGRPTSRTTRARRWRSILRVTRSRCGSTSTAPTSSCRRQCVPPGHRHSPPRSMCRLHSQRRTRTRSGPRPASRPSRAVSEVPPENEYGGLTSRPFAAVMASRADYLSLGERQSVRSVAGAGGRSYAGARSGRVGAPAPAACESRRRGSRFLREVRSCAPGIGAPRVGNRSATRRSMLPSSVRAARGS